MGRGCFVCLSVCLSGSVVACGTLTLHSFVLLGKSWLGRRGHSLPVVVVVAVIPPNWKHGWVRWDADLKHALFSSRITPEHCEMTSRAWCDRLLVRVCVCIRARCVFFLPPTRLDFPRMTDQHTSTQSREEEEEEEGVWEEISAFPLSLSLSLEAIVLERAWERKKRWCQCCVLVPVAVPAPPSLFPFQRRQSTAASQKREKVLWREGRGARPFQSFFLLLLLFVKVVLSSGKSKREAGLRREEERTKWTAEEGRKNERTNVGRKKKKSRDQKEEEEERRRSRNRITLGYTYTYTVHQSSHETCAFRNQKHWCSSMCAEKGLFPSCLTHPNTAKFT